MNTDFLLQEPINEGNKFPVVTQNCVFGSKTTEKQAESLGIATVLNHYQISISRHNWETTPSPHIHVNSWLIQLPGSTVGKALAV